MEVSITTLATKCIPNVNNFNLIFALLFVTVDICLFIQIFCVKIKKRYIILAILIDCILHSIYTACLSVVHYRLLNLVTVIILLRVLFKKSIEQCILGEIINLIITILLEALFSKFYCGIFHEYNYIEGIHHSQYTITLFLSVWIFKLVIYAIIKIKRITINIPDNLSLKNKRNIILISTIGFLLIHFNSIEMTVYISNFPYSIFLVDIFSLILYFYMSIQQIFKITELENKDQKITNLRNYNKTLTNMYDSIRGFRHDFSNFVQALEGYVEVNDINGIKAMSRDILKDCSEVSSLECLNPKVINNPAIYSILSNKYYNAKKENIDINIEMFTDLTKIKISTYELCRILAILLDNAIEAARECDNKIINVKFIKDNTVNRDLVIVENSYKNKNIDIEKIFEKGESSKQSLDDKHGLGLWNVRKILKHSKNLNLYTSKKDLFCQQLEIYR